MVRQPGTARTQTIMVSFDSPSVAVAAATQRESARPGSWRDDAWQWRDAEIRRLLALSSEQAVGPRGHSGGGGVAQDPVAPLIRTLLETPDKGEPMRRLLSELVSNSNLFDALVEVEGATNFSSVIELARQRKGARALHAVINNPVSTLAEIREVLRSEWWVFGSRYIPAFSRGRIPVLQQIDLPLIRSDGAVHLIALGEANIGDLVVPAEDGYQVGPRVPELVNRAMNQLLILETQAAAIRDILGVESRRAFATLVIGHPAYVAGQVSKDNVRSTLRTFSSHLSGLEIMTYKDLMDSAEKTLDLVERAQLDPHSMFGGAG